MGCNRRKACKAGGRSECPTGLLVGAVRHCNSIPIRGGAAYGGRCDPHLRAAALPRRVGALEVDHAAAFLIEKVVMDGIAPWRDVADGGDRGVRAGLRGQSSNAGTSSTLSSPCSRSSRSILDMRVA